jgi:hypothetical protein
MLDRRAAETPVEPRAVPSWPAGRERRRALVACALLVLVLHVAFIAHIGGVVTGAAETAVAPMAVRTLEARAVDVPSAPSLPEPGPIDAPAVWSLREEGRVDRPAETALQTPAPAPVVVAAATPRSLKARPLRPPSPAREAESKASQPIQLGLRDKASADFDNSTEASPDRDPARESSARVEVSEAPIATAVAAPAASATSDLGDVPIAAATPGGRAVPPPLLGPGDEPPPLYRTQLPPPATLHYQARRGGLHGTGQIRWQPGADRYRLVLEAYVGGVMLLTQTSEGGIEAHGLAPTRFLDHRARRSAQAANFRRDDGRITFSGANLEWPLLPGSQDRLSWMIQLAGIAAAEPARLVDGGRIAMVVVGARGDAAVWTLRYAGRQTIATVRGTVHAVKLVRDGRSPYDTSAEIWLDPERSYLPARATLRNGASALEYDLLLERIDPD